MISRLLTGEYNLTEIAKSLNGSLICFTCQSNILLCFLTDSICMNYRWIVCVDSPQKGDWSQPETRSCWLRGRKQGGWELEGRGRWLMGRREDRWVGLGSSLEPSVPHMSMN